MLNFSRILLFSFFIFNFGTILCVFERTTHNRSNSDPNHFYKNEIIGIASSKSCEGLTCNKENYFLLKVCHFLANRATNMSSQWATASPGQLLLNSNKMRWRCVQHLNVMLTASSIYPHMDKWIQFLFKSEDGQTNLLLGAILVGGPLLNKLNIYDASIKYDDNFFNTILKYVIYNETTHAKMVDKLLIVTKPTQWPTLLTNLVPMNFIVKLGKSQEHTVVINNIYSTNKQQQLRITVAVRVKPPNGYGFIYTVERHGESTRHDGGTASKTPMPMFKIGLFNDLREHPRQHQEEKWHNFVMFVVEKVGPGLVNYL